MSISEVPWLAVLDQTRADSALAIALDVAGRLNTFDKLNAAIVAAPRQSSIADSVRWHPSSISNGSAGLAVMFGYLDDCFPGEGWGLAARQHIELAAHSVERSDYQRVSLFGGLSGLAFATSCISKGGSRYRRLATSIDAALITLALPLISQVAIRTHGISYHSYDLISGLSGVGAYFLCHLEVPQARQVLEEILRALVNLAGTHNGLPCWSTPPTHLNDGTMAKEFPDGVLNCGLAHGIPGPLALLSLASLHSVEVAGLKGAIQRLAEWLEQHREDDSWGVNWPVVLPLKEFVDHSPSRSEKKRWPTRTAWCYGGPGVAWSLWLAGRALDRTDFRDASLGGMLAAVRRPVNDRLIPSPTFCHGVAGFLQINLRFYAESGRQEFRQAAFDLVDELVQAYEPNFILGFRSIEAEGRRVDNPGLLDGATGVALALLAAACPICPTWDRMFLLS